MDRARAGLLWDVTKTDPLAESPFYAAIFDSARIIIPLLPKCKTTSLILAWQRLRGLDFRVIPDKDTQSFAHCDLKEVHMRHAIEDVIALVRDKGYVVAIIARDPAERLASFYLNKTKLLLIEGWDWLFSHEDLPPLRTCTFEMTVDLLRSTIERRRYNYDVWDGANAHIAPYCRLLRPLLQGLLSIETIVHVFDMMSPDSMLRLMTLLRTRGMPAGDARCITNVKDGINVNVNPKGLRFVNNAHATQPDLLPDDMSYESLYDPALVKTIKEIYATDYLLFGK